MGAVQGCSLGGKMTVLWTTVYLLLLIEVGLLLMLLLSCIPTKAWRSLIVAIDRFLSDSVEYISESTGLPQILASANAEWLIDVKAKVFNVNVFFWKYVALLSLLFLNCLREVWVSTSLREQQSRSITDTVTGLGSCAGLDETIAMFRAQRNLYIVGATLGLALVIRRVAMLAVTLGRVREERNTGYFVAKQA